MRFVNNGYVSGEVCHNYCYLCLTKMGHYKQWTRGPGDQGPGDQGPGTRDPGPLFIVSHLSISIHNNESHYLQTLYGNTQAKHPVYIPQVLQEVVSCCSYTVDQQDTPGDSKSLYCKVSYNYS